MKKKERNPRGGAARGRSKIKKDSSSEDFSRSRSRLKAVSPSDVDRAGSDTMDKTARKPRAHTDIRGYSIGLKMSMLFGFLVAIMVFLSLLVLSTIVESSLEDEIKSSGVKSTIPECWYRGVCWGRRGSGTCLVEHEKACCRHA